MNTSQHQYDSIETIIFDNDLKMVSIDFHRDINTMLITLNTGRIIESAINITKKLAEASSTALHDYKIIADGTGIHWTQLDEDISLKSILRLSMQNQLLDQKPMVSPS